MPHFGYCVDSKVNDKYVTQTIKFQERLLKNFQVLLKDKKVLD